MVRRRSSLLQNDNLFYIFNYFILTIIFIIVTFPLINVVSNSFSSANAITTGRVFIFPVEPTFAGYKIMLKSHFIFTGFRNSILYTGLSIVISVVITTMAAFSLAQKDLYGRSFFIIVFTFTMLFSGGLIPTYILITKYLSLKDSIWSMVLPNALAVWNLIITRTYFQNAIPVEMYEAAELDGCSDFKSFTMIALPLAKPIIAVIALYYAIWSWNSFFDGLLYLSKTEMFPLQLTLRTIVQNAQLVEIMMRQGANYATLDNKMGTSEILKYCLIVVSSLPVLLLYPFAQKYFIKGIMIGSLKG